LILLHADSTGSPTWFLDSCGATTSPKHRLLLTHHDVGAEGWAFEGRFMMAFGG
jgi:hypothetical protein